MVHSPNIKRDHRQRREIEGGQRNREKTHSLHFDRGPELTLGAHEESDER